MDSKLKNDIQRRQEAMTQYYQVSIGQKIKKRRIDLQMTQESVGKGIISNTFVSKLENNAIRANKECLMLLMERLEMPSDVAELPEAMIGYLERSIECFYWNDRVGYQVIYDEVEKYDFAILIQIVRLGYHVLFRHIDEAKLIQSDLYRYLSSMENHAFSVFLLFGSAHLIQSTDFESAEEFLTAVSSIMQNDSRLLALTYYYKSVLYGRIHHHHLSEEAAGMAKRMFADTGNFRRMMQIHVDRLEFAFNEHNGELAEYRGDQVGLLDAEDQDRYHLLLALTTELPLPYLDKIAKDSLLFPFAMFLRCRYHLTKNDMQSYEQSKETLKNHGNRLIEPVDYYHLLVLHENPDRTGYKEYLNETLLPYALKLKNIRLIKCLQDEITTLLAAKKRYKDACCWSNKIDDNLRKIQENKKKS
jgi:transcriptional regulator with XRE-family HTH domain